MLTLMKYWNFISSIGISEEMGYAHRNRVVLSNRLAIFFIILGVLILPLESFFGEFEKGISTFILCSLFFFVIIFNQRKRDLLGRIFFILFAYVAVFLVSFFSKWSM